MDLVENLNLNVAHSLRAVIRNELDKIPIRDDNKG